jgi:hypothetical protein
MKRQIVRSHLVAAVFAVAATVAAVPAFAQRAPNDGGIPPEPPATALHSQSSSAPATTTPYYGRAANDGGTGPQPTAAQLKAAEQSQNKTDGQPAAPTHLGRAANDGGSIN